MKNLYCGFVLLVCIAPVFADVSLGVQWKKTAGGNDHYYWIRVEPGGIHWDAAYIKAEASGGYLATITSEAEHEFIANLALNLPQCWIIMQGGNDVGPWIGGYQPVGSPEPDGNWQWVTGEDFIYMNWVYGIPSNSMGGDDVGESRLHLSRGDDMICYWNDYFVTAKCTGYVVEFEPRPCTKYIPGDFNSDCKIDLQDFANLASHWMECNLEPITECW